MQITTQRPDVPGLNAVYTNAAPCWSGVDADDRQRERHRVRRSHCITAMQFCQE